MNELLHFILLGDFGLLTLTPKYLFLVLFPIMVCLETAGELLPRIPVIGEHIFKGNFFYYFIGLGCTTAALTAAGRQKHRLALTLILLVPCSSQIAIMACFATMVSPQVFVVFVLLSAVYICVFYVAVWCRHNEKDVGCSGSCSEEKPRPPLTPALFCRLVKKAFLSVTETAPSFCVGSVIVSITIYYGIMDMLCLWFQPFMKSFLNLPSEAVTLLLFNMLKRDFGSATLLSLGGSGAFDAVQLVTLLIMMTFSVPCFNSTVLLYRQEGPLWSAVIWSASFLSALMLGKATQLILLVLIGN